MKAKAAILKDTVDSIDEHPASIDAIEVLPPGPEEVLVQIRAASLCHTDNGICLGFIDQPHPLVMGHEGAGIVQDVGEDISTLSPGDHVVLGRIACGQCESCRAGKSQLCRERMLATSEGTLRDGAVRFNYDDSPAHHCHGVSSLSEYTVVNEEVAIPITHEVPLETASLLGCGVFTGIGAVTNTANVEAGASVAVFGLGGVGLSAIQGANLRGAGEIIGIDIVDEKLSIANDVGADWTIDAHRQDPVEKIREELGGVDYAIDVVGDPRITEQVLDVLNTDGTAVIVGIPPAGKHELPVDLHKLVRTERTVLGSFNGSFNLSLAIPRLAELVADGSIELEPIISDRRSLDEINEAMVDLDEGGAVRQVILPD